jgi:energy-coupling factor transporter ATP-binding protein EcfA2
MYLKRIALQDIKGFKKVWLDLERQDGSYAGWTVFAGPNGSGKSTLLKAMALSIGGEATARSLEGNFDGWIRSGAESGVIRAFLEVDKLKDKSPPPKTSKRHDLELAISFHIGTNGKQTSLLRSGYEGKGPLSDAPDGWFICGYGPFRRVSGHATDAIRLMAGRNHIGRLVNLFREDSSLMESLQWMKEVHTRHLEGKKGASELKKDILTILDDGLLPAGVKVLDFDSDGLWVEQNGTKLSLERLSDGYRTMSAFVLDLSRQLYDCYGSLNLRHTKDGHITIKQPGVVLVDEMDIHLHVSWQKKVGFWLKSRFPQIQFLVTSHSPFICQAADTNGLIRLPGPGDESKVAPVSEEVFTTVVNGGADDAVMTELFGLERTHSEKSEQLRDRIADLEVEDLEQDLTDEKQKELDELRKQLPNNPKARLAQATRNLGKM